MMTCELPADQFLRQPETHRLHWLPRRLAADYEIAPQFNGRPLTKTAQIELAGNSVCPQVAEAIVAANTREREEVAA